jgi:hypothetical protein
MQCLVGAQVLLEMLGTRYAMPGGCSPHDADQLKPLVDKLSAADEATDQRAQEQEKTATLPLQAPQCEGHQRVEGLLAFSDAESADASAQEHQDVQPSKSSAAARIARIRAGIADLTSQLQKMQHELSEEADLQVQVSLYRETCEAFLHLRRRFDAIRAVRSNPMPNCHAPSNQTSKRGKDAKEGQRKRRVAPDQIGDENSPLPGFVPQIGCCHTPALCFTLTHVNRDHLYVGP